MAAAFPVSIKSFLTYEDQHGPVTGPDDKSIIYAYIVNEIHDEVKAVETTMGLHPFTSPGNTNLGSTLQYIYHTKAPKAHTHSHHSLLGLGANDHPQYVTTDGTQGFWGPVGGVSGYYGNQLITLGQLVQMASNGQVMTEATLDAEISSSLTAFGTPCQGAPCVIANAGTVPVRGTGQGPEMGPPPPNSQWTITGGVRQGYTDVNGNLYISFGQAFRSTVVSFNFMRLPMPEHSAYGYTYQFMEDQLLVRNITLAGATVQFAEDIVIDRSAWVNMTWIAIGI